jgi:hypothetical protein
VADHGVFQRFAELLAEHEVHSLGHADLIVQQLAQRFQGQVFLLERGHALQALFGESVQPRKKSVSVEWH